MTNKVAVLIVSLNDANLSLNNGKSKIALDYSILLENNKDIEYLFDDIPNNIENLPLAIARNWYRNNNGIDTHKGKYSIGMVLEKRISLMISNTIKFYYGFLSKTKKYHKIEVPKNYPDYLINIINIFKEKILITSQQEYSNDFEVMFAKRAEIKKININKLSWIFRILQKPFLRFLRNKILVFPDWTYSKLKNNTYIYQNKINIFKSFYYKDSNNYLTYDIPKINTNVIIDLLIENGIQESDIKILSDLIINTIKQEAYKSLDVIAQHYAVMNELIKYYKPKQFIVPDDGEYPSYNMLLQISHKSNTNSVSVLDGYLTHLDKKQIKVIEDGITPLVKNYATMGSINHNLVGNISPKLNRIFMKSPILSHISSMKKMINKYDALVMMPIPNPLNPNSRWDMRNKYIIDVIKLLKSHNYKKIAIKIKPGHDLKDTEFLIRFFKKNNIENIEFLRGYGYDAISVSKIIIGQLGTATFESLVMKKPYYIYEPINCGLNNSSLNSSIAEIKHIARDINALSKNLDTMETIDLPINQLVDGQEMSMRII